METLLQFMIDHLNDFTSIALMMTGLYAMMARRNLVKKLVGLNIFQWAIILFFVSLGAKNDGAIPVITDSVGEVAAGALTVDPGRFDNPLPHVLMLTAIVVGVATTGVAMALLLRIYKKYGSMDGQEILKKLDEY